MKWVFEGRVYSSLEELSGETMSEGNKPEPVFTETEVREYALYVGWTRRNKNISPNELFSGDYVLPSDTVTVKFFDKNKVVGEGAESESKL